MNLFLIHRHFSLQNNEEKNIVCKANTFATSRMEKVKEAIIPSVSFAVLRFFPFVCELLCRSKSQT